MIYFRAAAVVALMCCGSVLHADALTDLRAKLSPLNAKSAVRAEVEVQSTRAEEGQPAAPSRATVEVQLTDDALSISYSRSLLNAMSQEKKQNGAPGKGSDLSTTVNGINPTDVVGALDAAKELLHMLEDAKLLSDQQGALNGAPARLLTMKIDPHLTKEEMKAGPMRVKSIDLQLRIWLSPDGYPLYSEMTHSFKASVLLMSVGSTGVEKTSYARRDDRLIAIRKETEESSSGLGQSFKGAEVLVVKPH